MGFDKQLHEDFKDIGVLMHKRRKSIGISILQLANRANLSKSIVAGVEAGRRSNTKTLLKMGYALGMTREMLFELLSE